MVRASHAFAAARGILPSLSRAREQNEINGHARIIANPTYQRLLNAEPWFRRLIPLFVITFLALIGFARGIQLSENREATLDKAQENLTLIATLIEHQFEAVSDDISRDQIDNQLIAALADFKPAGATRDGRVLLITNAEGYIHAEEPASNRHRGTYLADNLEPTQPLLTFGEKAGVMTVKMIATGEPALATVRHLPHELGTITIYQPKEALLAQWRSDVSLNASIFLGTSILLVVMLYAFFSQTTRADEADAIYHKTYGRFDTALKRGKCGLWDWDIGRGRAFWSPSMYEILGLPPRQSLIGFGEVNDLVHPDDIDFLLIAENVLSGNLNHVDQIYRMRHADGHWIWVRVRGETVINGPDETPHLIGICIDVSDQVKLETENRTANIRLRESIESLSEAFVLWDTRNNLIVCNEKYRELNGLPTELVVPGVSYDDVVSAATTPQIAFQTDEPLNNGFKGRTYETQLQDGRWLQINERRTNDGGYVSTGTDITHIKKNEENLRKRELELQATIEHLERSEDELRKLAHKYSAQREIALNANRAKSEFLANISHEWRTPLNAIIGFSDIMRQGVFGSLGSAKYEEYCQDINESGTYMLAFINDVLDMSEIEAGRFELEHEEVDAAEIIDDVIKSSKPEADGKNVSISCTTDSPLMMIADRRALKQIIHNLVSNAVKFNKSGGTVTINCQRHDDRMELHIEDTGIGISSDAIGQLGDPFKQVQNQLTKNHTGSGLGLSISKSLVEMHGGVLMISSVPGKGTQISINIPLAEGKTAAVA